MPERSGRATRTRIDAERRRRQIIEATHRATLRLGLHDLRMQDVAAELDVSTALIHYHFDTRDDLIEAMLRATAAEEVAGVRALIDSAAEPERRLAQAVEIYLPSERRDPSWVLWIDVWGEALRDVNLRRISEELDQAWVDLIGEIIRDGQATGVFTTDDPMDSAWRLCAMLDGLGTQVVLHETTMTRTKMRNHVRHAAAQELGYELQF